MKTNLLKTFLMLAVLVMGNLFAQAQNGRIDLRGEAKAEITHSEFTTLRAVFSYGSIESNEMVTERGTFSEIALSGTYPSGEIGSPELPATHQLLAVPFGATPHVSVISYTTTDYRLSDFGINTIMPRQPSVRKDQRPEDIPFAYNASAYQTRALATTPEASIEVQGTMRGIRIGSLVVNPVSYNAASNTLRVFNDIEVEVNFEGADYAETERMLVSTYSPYFDIIYKQMFNSRQIMDVYSDHPDLMAYPVHMIVITPQSYVSTLQPWVDWKIQKGFDVSVYTTSQTGSTYNAIRSYVQNLYNTGVSQGKTPTFLVLVGDVAQIPNTTGSSTTKVTDLYYGSIDSDYFPDMFYSRMSAENTTQLTAIINKILQYEQYTMPDPSYLSKTTLIAGWDSYWNPRVGQPTINYATTYYYNTAHGFTTVNAHLNQSQYTGCYNSLSSGVGFVNYTAHGDNQMWYDPQLTNSGVNALTNTNKYFLAMGNCCLSGNFGYSSPCFGEAMIRGENKGAYSYIGSCPETYWYEDYYFGVGATNTFSSTPTQSGSSTGVYDAVWMDDTYNTVSSMTFLGNIAVCYANAGSYQTSTTPLYYWQAYHVLGDGSIMPYRVNPTANTVSHDSSFPAGATSFTVNAQAGSYVGISQNNTLLGAALVPASGSVNVQVTPVASGTVRIVVTKPQRQPYIQDISVGGSATTYTITATSNPTDGGTVSGTGTFVEGTTCTLTATANSGYTFSNWTKNGNVVSTNATYSFTVTENAAYVANFTAIAPPPPTPTTLQVIAQYYPDANDPYSPYARVYWNEVSGESFEAQIGEGTSTFGYFPFYTLYNYSIAENLFLASELQTAGVTTAPMTSLSWYATNAPGYAQQGISIWMANVSDTELTSTSHTVDGMTLVYTGAMTPEIGWNEFAFNEGSFAWDGSSNVLIFVQRNNGEWNSTVQWQATSDLSFNASSYKYQDSEAYDVTVPNTMYTNTTRPNIIMKANGRNRDELTYDFEDSTMQGWTTIDADGDGYDWMLATSLMGSNYGNNGSIDCVLSQSYNNSVGALTPDNYLVSPQIALGGSISFYACAQDDAWAAEHFGVAVSTTNNTDASAFTTIQEWTMTAKGNRYDGPRGSRTQGTWYQYTVDLSAYAGQTGYVAIRHFNCTDWFYIDVDDITISTSGGSGSTYRVYRANCDGTNSQLIADNVTGHQYIDYSWSGMAVGNYKYGVSVVDDGSSEITWSNCLEKPVEQTYYQITAMSNPVNGGTVNGAGTYTDGSICTLTAMANSGYTFSNWTLNGTLVSTNTTISFTVNGDASYVANFTATTPPPSPTFQVIAEYYPDANDPNSPYVKVYWEEVTPSEGFPVDFESGMPAGWTVIDANNDGYTWCLTSDIPSIWSYYAGMTLDWYHSGSNAICSGSYINGVGALTPDDYFVSPQLTLENGSQLSFWVAATDVNYPADHFGVFVSTTGTDPSDFQCVQEWTLTAKKGGNTGDVRATRDGKGLRLGTWYQYTVDLSAYEGNAYIAFRHFDCEDQYIMCIDDITLTGTRDENVTYNVYRASCNGNEEELIAENITESQYIDTEWSEMAWGNYKYGVSIVDGGRESSINWVEPMASNRPLSVEEAAAMGIELCPNANAAAIQMGNRAAWDLLATFEAAEDGHYGVVTDGVNMYTSNWGYGGATWNFYKYDMQGNVIEGFNIDGCGTLRGMTYDGQYFYGVALSNTVYCVDLANHIVVNTFSSEYGVMRGITYDFARDGFWVIGNWSGNLTLINRNGVIQFVGPELTSISDCAYYMDEDGVEHVFCFNDDDNGVYDYNITTNIFGSAVFDFSNVPGYENSNAGGCHVGDYNGTLAFFGDMQESPNLIGIYEVGGVIPNGDNIIWSNCIEKPMTDGCTVYFDLYDAWGDGWNGNYLVVDYGNGVTEQLTFSSGSSASYSRSIEDGSHVMLSWITGSWINECSFTVHYADGTPIYESLNLGSEFQYEFDVNCAGPYNIYSINASAMPAAGGTVTGGDSYYEGQVCTLTATANEGYEFLNWTKNGVEVSAELSFSFTVTEDAAYVAHFASEGYYWDYDHYAYPDNMSVTGVIQIEGVEQRSSFLEVGAFCNGECRGRERPTYISNFDRYIMFLSIYGEDGDQIEFRLYDHATGMESTLACETVLTFHVNDIYGNIVDPFVLNFVGADMTQTASFVSGWNWWSGYVELGADALSSFESGLGSNGLMIKSQNDGYASYLAGYGWYGSLNSINNESTYQVRVGSDCEVEISGTTANPADHPITLHTGWTWVGYPVSTNMSISEALSGIVPTNGDMLKSQNDGYASYLAGYGWYGSLNTITPGMGLMYKSNAAGDVTLIYPANGTRVDFEANLKADDNHFVPNLNAYPDNMSVMAVVELDDEELRSEHYELAAFANGEVRGSVTLSYVEPLDRYMAFLTVAGDEVTELTFGLYDAETGVEIMDCTQTINFSVNAVAGSFAEPYVVSFRGTTALDEFGKSLQVYPNPVAAGDLLNIGMSNDGTDVRVEIVNALGAVVSVENSTKISATFKAPSVPGVYTVRITAEGKGTYCRKLVVR